MRRFTLLGLVLLLPACNVVGNPVDGAGTFIGNTISFRSNPNRPDVDAPNVQRVTGQSLEAEPLQPDPGNVWPGPLPPAKTLGDLQREATSPLGGVEADPRTPLPRVGNPMPAAPPAALAPLPRPGSAPVAPKPGAYNLISPAGVAMVQHSAGGMDTFTLPSGVTGMVMNNGNGTVTLMGADGSVNVAPAPR